MKSKSIKLKKRGLIIFPAKAHQTLKDTIGNISERPYSILRFMEITEKMAQWMMASKKNSLPVISGMLKRKFESFNPEKDFLIVAKIRNGKKAKRSKQGK